MKKHFNLLGNIAHVFIGLNLMYVIGFLTAVPTYTLEGKYIGFPAVSLVIPAVLCMFWNYFKNVNFNIKSKLDNVIYSSIGGILSAYLLTILPKSNFITYYCSTVSIVFTICYIYIMYKNKGK